jgi:hypothetical protein
MLSMDLAQCGELVKDGQGSQSYLERLEHEAGEFGRHLDIYIANAALTDHVHVHGYAVDVYDGMVHFRVGMALYELPVKALAAWFFNPYRADDTLLFKVANVNEYR